MAELKETKKAPAKKMVKVTAKFPIFVDLVNDIRIGAEPVEVELHPWLQAQISAGLLSVVE